MLYFRPLPGTRSRLDNVRFVARVRLVALGVSVAVEASKCVKTKISQPITVGVNCVRHLSESRSRYVYEISSVSRVDPFLMMTA